MKKKQGSLKLKVLFNASVVLSGLKSPNGGSGKLLLLIKKGRFEGKISEIIFDEVLRHGKRLGLPTKVVVKNSLELFGKFIPVPNEKTIEKYKKIVVDEGDAHVLASCYEEKLDTLVTLDKKHLLVLKGKVKGINIMTPGELIELLKK